MNAPHHPRMLRESDPTLAQSHFCHFCWPRLVRATHWDEGTPQLPSCSDCGGEALRVCQVPQHALEFVS